MRNILLIALIGLCFVVQGKAKTTNVMPSCTVESLVMEVQEGPSPELVNRILRSVALELDQDYQCLCEQYANGEITIEKSSTGYLLLDSGGGLIISIEDDI